MDQSVAGAATKSNRVAILQFRGSTLHPPCTSPLAEPLQHFARSSRTP